MLRVAVPNKGSLSEPARSMLREAGYLRSGMMNDLVVQDPENDTEFFFLRPKDIAIYVGAGTVDLGITGQDMLADSAAPATQVLDLGFAASAFQLAAPVGVAQTVHDLAGKRIATSYVGLLETWLLAQGVKATIVKLDGAVENAVKLGIADAVADVVDTGTTMRQAGLEPIGEPILRSKAQLIRPQSAQPNQAADTFIHRLEGVIVARSYVIMDYDISMDLVDAATTITPGLESPTVSPLGKEGWVAIRALVPRADTQRVMDELYQLGGRGIFVSLIHACRL